MTALKTYTHKRFGTLDWVQVQTPAPICPSDLHHVALITHLRGERVWHVTGAEDGAGIRFSSRKAAFDYVSATF